MPGSLQRWVQLSWSAQRGCVPHEQRAGRDGCRPKPRAQGTKRMRRKAVDGPCWVWGAFDQALSCPDSAAARHQATRLPSPSYCALCDHLPGTCEQPRAVLDANKQQEATRPVGTPPLGVRASNKGFKAHLAVHAPCCLTRLSLPLIWELLHCLASYLHLGTLGLCTSRRARGLSAFIFRLDTMPRAAGQAAG